MVGEGNLFHAYILKNVIKFQREFYFGGGGGLFEKGLVSQRETEVSLEKNQTNKMLRTFLVQWNYKGLLQLR